MDDILGLPKYWALRFDADLFALLARNTERTPDLDQALQTLGLQSPKRAGRPWTERRRGAHLNCCASKPGYGRASAVDLA